MVHGTQGGVDRGGEIKDLILDILREIFVVKPEGWHPDFQVFVANQRVDVGVGGVGWEREVTVAQESAEGGCVANATAPVAL